MVPAVSTATAALADGGCNVPRILEALGAAAAESVEAARHKPIRYISVRRAHAESDAALAVEPFPDPHPAEELAAAPPLVCPAWPAGAPERVAIADLFLANSYELVVRPWVRQAAARVRQWRAHVAGKAPKPSGTLEHVHLGQDCMTPWARGIVWDTRNPDDCRPLAPSSGAMLGPKLVSAEAFAAAAAALDWPDRDIVSQVTDGGLRANHVGLELKTMLAWHHKSAEAEFAAADAAVVADISAGWIEAACADFHLPFVPCRLVPKGVALQPRMRRRAEPPHDVEEYNKPRVTTDDSFPRDGSSPNAATPPEETATRLPRPSHLARAAAIAASSGLEVGLYAIDFSDAYRYTYIQRLDQPTQCTLWADGVHVEPRGVFGQAFMPNRFQRVAMLARAWGRRWQEDVGRLFPPPVPVAAWLDGRPDGGGIEYSHIYLDDTGGLAPTDIIPRSTWPQWLREIDLGEGPDPETVETHGPWWPRPWAAAAELAGGTPAHPESRVAVLARAMVGAYRSLGFTISALKLQISDRIIQLGFSTELDTRRMAVPPAKRDAMLVLADQLRAAAPAPREKVDRLVGRLSHLAHVLPSLLDHLHAGYAMVKAVVRKSLGDGTRVAKRPRWLQVQGDSPAQRDFQRLLDLAEHLMASDASVPLAARSIFPDPIFARLPTVVTDASGVVGFGGWTIVGDELWCFGEAWPESVRLALQPPVRFSVSAAELFTLGAAAAALGVSGPWAVAVGDSMAAAGAVHREGSSVATMRAMLAILQAASPGTAWLAAHVPRDINWVADALSKLEFDRVRRWAHGIGLRMVLSQVPEWALESLASTLAA